MKITILPLLALGAGLWFAAPDASASSHREAPFITKNPKVDATDFYMFRSFETGRADYVTLIANYVPLQDPYGGPNYFAMDPDALYEIHVDNNGDAREDITFQFRFTNTLQDFQLPIGPPGNQRMNSLPLVQKGGIAAGDVTNLNVRESYTLKVVYGDRRTGMVSNVVDAMTSATAFTKPVDNIGTKTLADYSAYAATHVREIRLPDGSLGRVFVGQRKDPFAVNLGEVFDLVNFVPLGDPAAQTDDLADANVTSLVLEVPIGFLAGADSVIGAWTTASVRQARVINPAPRSAVDNKVTVEGGAFTQVSRLGMPLVNEIVIGIKDKDRFNASQPKDDAQFADYVTHPTFPALIEILFGGAGVQAPTAFPRTDLVAVFLTGVTGLNQPIGVQGSEMLRLNTQTLPTPAAMQNRLGVLGGDLAGFPNGRRPGDDVVDEALRVVMGVLLDSADAPSGQLPYTDGAFLDQTSFDAAFPYLRTPLPGSPSAK
ncbi:MAG: DUF4331 domain-containing protein [Planctomycetes bacterium]|nr:DUF4331 domain-containing protein [Planctomycetota bacterium]